MYVCICICVCMCVCREVFSMLDTDGSGSIEHDEIIMGLRCVYVCLIVR